MTANNTGVPLVIEAQGSFAVGGTVIANPGTYDPSSGDSAGQTLRGDHAFVFYQVPANPRALPLVFLHGGHQFSRSWQTTPDGREGFQNIFLRRRFPVYLVDQPRRGGAGRSTLPTRVDPVADEQRFFDSFRIGVWPDYYPDVQFSRDPQALDQYMRQMTPDTGPFDVAVIIDAMAALLEKIGPAILVTHSQGGGIGWAVAIRSRNVRAIVSYEAGSNFAFPHGEVPPPMPAVTAPLAAVGVPAADFAQLARMPIVIYYGDNIAEQPVTARGPDHWRVRLAMARLWAAAVNRHGGDATVVHLPQQGIRGNTHFPFSDLNNVVIADLMSDFLKQKGLDA